LDPDVIDAHVHLYRDIDKERQALPVPGRRDRDRWGNADSLIGYMDREGISHIVALNLFPTGLLRPVLLGKLGEGASANPEARAAVERDLADRMRKQNEWLCALASREPRVLAGIGMQKLLSPDEMVEEVELRASSGARAVKLIPGWYHEFPNDRAYWPMFDRCQELGLVITSDTGTLGLGRHMAHPDEDNEVCYGEPRLFQEVLEAFPRLSIVMCHFGSAFWDQRLEMSRRYPNLFFDISGGFCGPGVAARDGDRALPEQDAVRVMREVGLDRLMFGSDGPVVMVQPYLEQVLRLRLTDAERRMLLTENARRIYRIV